MKSNTANKVRRSKTSKNVVKLIRKSNELVEARYKFDIWETRIFTKMLSMVHKNDEDFQPYRIYLSDIVKDFQVENNKDAYDRLRRGGNKLMSKIIKVIRETDEGLMELTTPIVVGVDRLVNPNSEDGKFIDVSFHPDMRPFLLSLKSQFTIYDVNNILKLPSSYSIRLYELLKQYERIGSRKFQLQELKEIIGVIEEIDNNGKKLLKDNYPLFGNFKQRVLLKAQRDLKKFTDIQFEFDPFKRGRKIVGVVFTIRANNGAPRSSKVKALKNIHPKQGLIDDLYLLTKDYVGKKVVEKWVDDYPEFQVREGINYTIAQLKNGVQIENVGGYLHSMVRQSIVFNPVKEKVEKQKRVKQKIQEDALKKEDLEAQLKIVYSEVQEKETAIIEEICNNNPEASAKAMEQVSNHSIAREQYDPNLSDTENLKSRVVRITFINAIRKQYPAKFKSLDKTYDAKIKQLKNWISTL